MTPPPDWVSLANPADLDLVARALDDGRLVPGRDTVAALQALGVAHVDKARRFLRDVPVREGRALAWALHRLADERRQASDRLARSAQLVWSGPSEGHGGLRDTRAVLDEVCRRAQHHVLVATYVVYDGLQSLAALAKRMREHRDLLVDLYVHLEAPAHVDEAHAVTAWLRRFHEHHWPADLRLPAVWYDPATLDRSAGVSLHAKCVVVDGRHAFVTSANFTEAAQARNVEVGVLLDHPALAQELVGQFQSLREHGRFRRMPGT